MISTKKQQHIKQPRGWKNLLYKPNINTYKCTISTYDRKTNPFPEISSLNTFVSTEFTSEEIDPDTYYLRLRESIFSKLKDYGYVGNKCKSIKKNSDISLLVSKKPMIGYKDWYSYNLMVANEITEYNEGFLVGDIIILNDGTERVLSLINEYNVMPYTNDNCIAETSTHSKRGRLSKEKSYSNLKVKPIVLNVNEILFANIQTNEQRKFFDTRKLEVKKLGSNHGIYRRIIVCQFLLFDLLVERSKKNSSIKNYVPLVIFPKSLNFLIRTKTLINVFIRSECMCMFLPI